MKLSPVQRADLVVLGILLPVMALVGLLAYVLTPAKRVGVGDRRASTFHNAPGGAKAAYLVAQQMGYPVTQFRRVIEPHRLEALKGLIILQPEQEPSKDELAAVLQWVRDGGRLLVSQMDSGWLAQNPRHLQAPAQPVLRRDDPLLAGVGTLNPGDTQRRLANQDVPIGPLRDAPHAVLWGDEAGALLVRIELGQGRIIALADPSVLANDHLGSYDHVALWVNLLDELGQGGTIAFAEYHHGFAEHESFRTALTKLVFAERWRGAAAQAVLVGLLALLTAAVRFGRPDPVRVLPRRSHGEFARAAGRLLYEQHATRPVCHTLYHHYRGLLTARTHLRPDAGDRELADALARRGVQHAERALSRARSLLDQPALRREHAHEIARTLHHLLEQSEHAA